MSSICKKAKKVLGAAIQETEQRKAHFLRCPDKDFTRNRKLPFSKMLCIMIGLAGGSLTNELMDFFHCSPQMASSSAFIQQRAKIKPEAFEFLFHQFSDRISSNNLYRGYRLLAADGSDIQTATDPNDSDAYYPGANGQKAYNLHHLNALYDLLGRFYVDGLIQKSHNGNECRALIQMIDRSTISNAIITVDRNYENYNVMAHIQEKGWFYLIRVKDGSNGITSGRDLPASAEFDFFVNLQLTRKQTNEAKALFKNRNHFCFMPASSVFDYLPVKCRKRDPAVFYAIPFRIVRFLLPSGDFETVVTNLPAHDFPPDELKKLYAMRWGIETSFRELKYTVGLLHFHAKKAEYIYQEIFASLVMYNFTELITSQVVTHSKSRKYAYMANFSVAVHACRQFLQGNVSPPSVEAIISRNLSPVRPGRSNPRKMTQKNSFSFLYRVA